MPLPASPVQKAVPAKDTPVAPDNQEVFRHVLANCVILRKYGIYYFIGFA